ncbi:hypothetical protein SAMN05518849_11652 [Sphingobium sp. AP50]|uniref:hypothetical protein n=1 Tax=Sphingobium sp. AP50 TaxID=1884369 RepID=UPI0008B6DC2F|nr:hypothetical protein [Sphingobium sp. AP50]SEJ87062.1 hypothetical protein SAMN05518849_11652 [Sphingobium sp. AP50]
MMKYAVAMAMMVVSTGAMAAKAPPPPIEQSTGPILWQGIRAGMDFREVRAQFPKITSLGTYFSYPLAPKFVVDVEVDLETRKHPDGSKTQHVRKVTLDTIDDYSMVLAALLEKYGEPRRKEERTQTGNRAFTPSMGIDRHMTDYEWYKDGVLIKLTTGAVPGFILSYEAKSDAGLTDAI